MKPEAFSPRPFAHHRVERVELPCSLAEIATGLAGERYVFLLDSAAVCPRLGEYSFLAVRPSFVLRVRRQGDTTRVRVEYPDRVAGPLEFDTRDPFEVVRQALRATRGHVFISGERQGLGKELPFVGGLVGYIGYEMLHFLEAVAEGPVEDLDVPDLLLAASDSIVAVCHGSGEAFLSVTGRGADAASARRQASELLAELRALVASGQPPVQTGLDGPRLIGSVGADWSASLSKDDYQGAVVEIKERIAAGDLYQMNLTRRMSHPYDGSVEDLYRLLRRSNPAPFGAYYKLPEASVLSCSPERFLRMDRQGRIETRPRRG